MKSLNSFLLVLALCLVSSKLSGQSSVYTVDTASRSFEASVKIKDAYKSVLQVFPEMEFKIYNISKPEYINGSKVTVMDCPGDQPQLKN